MANQDDSFWEWLRPRLWPRLGWGGHTFANQYAGTLDMSEDEIETVLRQLGFSRNPVAYLKSRSWSPGDSDGVSEGSWVRRRRPWAPMQHHITLFSNDDGTYDLAAHWEANFLTRPVAHLNATDFHPEVGVELLLELLATQKIYPHFRYD